MDTYLPECRTRTGRRATRRIGNGALAILVIAVAVVVAAPSSVHHTLSPAAIHLGPPDITAEPPVDTRVSTDRIVVFGARTPTSHAPRAPLARSKSGTTPSSGSTFGV